MLTPKFTCRAVIFFLAWLVQLNIFTEATFFCMMVGHTYSRIDQTFRTLIGYMMARALWTVEDMITAIAEYLRAYNCLGCMELHSMWAWKDWFRPHVYIEFGNFATSVHACHAPLYCTPPLLLTLGLEPLLAHRCTAHGCTRPQMPARGSL